MPGKATARERGEPHFNFLHGYERRLLELAQQKLLFDALPDARMQSSNTEPFSCG
jgi:hypothetical protein